MMRATAALLLASAPAFDAFTTPGAFTRRSAASRCASQSSSARAAVDPSSFLHDLPANADGLHHAFSSLLVSDGGLSSAIDAASTVAADVVNTAVTTGASDSAATAMGAAAVPAGAADAAVATDNGWFGFLTGPIEGLLKIIHDVLVGVGVSADAWGVSIIVMTLFIKLVTFPLTKSQLESTNKMQMLQPTIKDIQAKYQSNPEVMNQKIAEVYQTNQVNPLAGCIPSLVQIPVFIGLYRAVLTLAKDNALDEPFLWLPNLEGPVYGADPAHGSDWLLKGWESGAPSLGWDDTLAFLTIPIVLVVSQYVSMQIMQPKSEDPQQQQANAILKVLPLMIGWFSINVPAALGIYWVTNNFVTTATTLYVRSTLPGAPVAPGGGAAAASSPVVDMKPSEFVPSPMREKPSGFASEPDPNEVTPITPIDAEVIAEDAVEDTSPPPPRPPQQKRGKKKKKRRN